jgi:hypothetical protein
MLLKLWISSSLIFFFFSPPPSPLQILLLKLHLLKIILLLCFPYLSLPNLPSPLLLHTYPFSLPFHRTFFINHTLHIFPFFSFISYFSMPSFLNLCLAMFFSYLSTYLFLTFLASSSFSTIVTVTDRQTDRRNCSHFFRVAG